MGNFSKAISKPEVLQTVATSQNANSAASGLANTATGGLVSAISQATGGASDKVSGIFGTGGTGGQEVIKIIKNIFGGGGKYWQVKKREYEQSGLTLDEIFKTVADTRNGQEMNQLLEFFAHKAPSQGHGWSDRTSELHKSVGNYWNNICSQINAPSDFFINVNNCIDDVTISPAPPVKSAEVIRQSPTKEIVKIMEQGLPEVTVSTSLKNTSSKFLNTIKKPIVIIPIVIIAIAIIFRNKLKKLFK